MSNPLRSPWWALFTGVGGTAAAILADLKANRELMDRTSRELGMIHSELRGIRATMEPLLQLERRVAHLEALARGARAAAEADRIPQEQLFREHVFGQPPAVPPLPVRTP